MAFLEIWDVNPPSLRVSLQGHETTRCAAFSPDSQTLATGGDDRNVCLWDARTGDKLATFEGHPGLVSSVVFSLDGTRLASACDGKVVKLWSVAERQELATLEGHREQIYCSAISPDGRWLLTGGGNWTSDAPGELIVWDLETGELLRRMNADRLALWAIVYAPDGKTFATSSSTGSVKIWDAKTFALKRTLQHATWIRPIAFSPDGRTLSVGRGDGSVRLWDTTNWRQRAACDGHPDFTFCLHFAPQSGTLISGGNDGTVRFWPTDLGPSSP